MSKLLKAEFIIRIENGIINNVWPKTLNKLDCNLLLVGYNRSPAIKALDNTKNIKVIGIDNDMRSYFFGKKSSNKWKEKEFFKSNYIASKDVNAWLGLYEVNK